MAVAAPAADKRFRRAHVNPVRRRTWRDRLPTIARVVVALAIVAYGGYRAVVFAYTSPTLAVSKIRVAGNSRLAKGEVMQLLDGLRGSNMLTVDLDDWRHKLLASPWVADAALRRAFPGTVDVAISERLPLGIGRINDALYLVDQRATVIDEYGPNYADVDLPIIDGLASESSDGLLVDARRTSLAGRVLTELQRRPDLAKRISQIDVTDLHDAVIILKGDTTLVRIGEERFAERVQTYLDLAPTLRERVPAIDYVDLRFDERVYVRPVGGIPKIQKAKS
jgi:cell division septal protein FtsQ